MVNKADLYKGCRVVSLVKYASGVLVNKGCFGTVVKVFKDDFTVHWDTKDKDYYWCGFEEVELAFPDDDIGEDDLVADIDIRNFLFDNAEK